MLRNCENAYGGVAIVFHWTIALLFIGQLVLGYTMTRVKSMALQFELIQWHKSVGFLILALAVLRLLWRLGSRQPRAAPGRSAGERVAAKTVQTLLLAATIAVPLAGWALASTSTLGIPSLAFNLLLIPHLPLVPSGEAEMFWRRAHTVLAYGTGLLAAGHAAAALRHHFLLRDDTFTRILPVLKARTAQRAGPTTEKNDA